MSQRPFWRGSYNPCVTAAEGLVRPVTLRTAVAKPPITTPASNNVAQVRWDWLFFEQRLMTQGASVNPKMQGQSKQRLTTDAILWTPPAECTQSFYI